MSPGARYCHRCGASSLAGAHTLRKSTDAAVPWAVAAIAMVALIALVAGRRFGGNGNAVEATPLSAATNPGVVRGPDISQMTPAERAESLHDRLLRLSDAGHVDSVRFFAPMAIASYQAIESITEDQRFDLGRIGMLTGLTEVARAQADTLLSRNPNHLLGLTLAINAAQADRDSGAVRTLRKRLAASAGSSVDSRVSARHQAHVDETVRMARNSPQ